VPQRRSPARPREARFGPTPASLVPLLIVWVGTFAVATWPPLSWLPLLPPLAAVWVLRARVVVREDALEVGNGLRRRRVPWERVEGFDVPRRGPVRLLEPGRRTPLTAVPRREVPRLLAAAEELAGPGARR
jgi:hypothetical protein